MNTKLRIFVAFCCVCLWTIKENSAQNARCDYKYQNWYSLNNSHYRCDLSTKQANYDETLTKIDGQHLSGHSDADVKTIINYNNNKLKTISSIFCQKFPNLEHISIFGAELESIDEDSLLNCKKLDDLALSVNKIRELPEYFLIRNSKLTRFLMDNNQLITLHENLFLNQNELEILHLQNNQIIFMPANIFRPLVKLQLLYLFGNKIQSINPKWFVTLQNLKSLGFNKNQISEFPSECFASLRNLENLWLNENKLRDLKPRSFVGLQNLQLLNLDSNEISDISLDVFTQLGKLQRLVLSNNKLTIIHSNSFGIHNQLTSVWLENNEINAIDPKFIDKTAVSGINITNNVCSQLVIITRSEVKPNLKKCFDNYKPRFSFLSQIRPQTPTTSLPIKTPAILSSKCGNSKNGHSNIIGGTHIKSGDYPWIAALMTPAGKFFCGGTLVSSRKIVTAAHCIQDKKTTDRLSASDLTVLIGMHDLNKFAEVGRAFHAVYSINVHPDWNTLTQAYDADIAVLVLETEVTFNQHVQPICLPVPNSNITTIGSGSVIGYGKSEDDTKEHENIPKIIETPIHNNDDCFKANKDLTLLSSGRTFCGGSGKGVGVCSGDSGSGLIVSDGSAYYLRGVVSSSLFRTKYGCDVDNYAVFTDVLRFIDWINGVPINRFSVHRKK